MILGCHLSTAKGFLAMGNDALKIGGNTFQFFTRNPRGGRAKAIDSKDANALLALVDEHAFGKLLAHAPYTLNACSAEAKTREFAAMAMEDDLLRMEYFPGNLYNFHPGSHVGQGAEAGIKMIAQLLNALLKPEQTTTVLLETMSGKGSEVGYRFEELQQILDQVELTDKMGVCMDTCHVYAAGYDIVDNLDGVLEEFDTVVGLERLQAIHLNDSMHPLGSRKDRHARIGEGTIGLDAMVRIINHPLLRDLPFFLETPHESLEGYAQEIQLLRSHYKQA